LTSLERKEARYHRRKEKREAKRRERVENNDFERVIDPDNLYKAAKAARRGVF